MNLILLSPQDLLAANRARVHQPRQVKHIREVHRSEIGSQVNIGFLNGQLGSGIIVAQNEQEILLEIGVDQSPPPPLPLKLILAMPRPKMFRRILQTIATLGVKEVHIINSYRVEKSYWQTPFLSEDAIHEQLVLGLEQGCDTQMPIVLLHKLFKPFVEDELPQIIQQTKAIVAHPYTSTPCPHEISLSLTLAVGPEGGFIPYEIELLEACGFEAVNLGERIMRVETVIPYLLGRLS